MSNLFRWIFLTGLVCVMVPLNACDRHDHDAKPPDVPAAQVAGRLTLSPLARENLSIRFAPVQREQLAQTLRVAGMFELQPQATRRYRAVLDGRVTLHVEQYEKVQAGQLLAQLQSPAWRQMQHETAEAQGQIKIARAQSEVAQASLEEAQQSLAFVQQRLTQFNQSGQRHVELEAEQLRWQHVLARMEAERAAAQVQLHEAEEHYVSRLKILASITGDPVEFLTETIEDPAFAHPVPRYRLIQQIAIHAHAPGVIDSVLVTQGDWVAPGDLLLTSVDPEQVRLRAMISPADAATLRDGMAVEMPAPLAALPPAVGRLHLGYEADPRTRMFTVWVDLATPIPAWARAGMAAMAEVVVQRQKDVRITVPVSALVQDGLETILFRRDPDDADVVWRVQADLGLRQGNRVEVLSGLTDTDQIVVEGAYALKLADGGGSRPPQGHHYHADGTLHRDH